MLSFPEEEGSSTEHPQGTLLSPIVPHPWVVMGAPTISNKVQQLWPLAADYLKRFLGCVSAEVVVSGGSSGQQRIDPGVQQPARNKPKTCARAIPVMDDRNKTQIY